MILVVLFLVGCVKATPPQVPEPTVTADEEPSGPPVWPFIDEPEVFQVSRCEHQSPVDGRVQVSLRWPSLTRDVTYRVLLWGWQDLVETKATRWEGSIPYTGDGQITDGPWAFTVVAVDDAGMESEPQGIWGCEALANPPVEVEPSATQDAILRGGGSLMDLLGPESP